MQFSISKHSTEECIGRIQSSAVRFGRRSCCCIKYHPKHGINDLFRSERGTNSVSSQIACSSLIEPPLSPSVDDYVANRDLTGLKLRNPLDGHYSPDK
ncbi:hypothetical protein GWI33_017112 [Rhynchophorus ferrugineus]|uniref:Uncharacterized protein n=1 Tax=Rhynchophorus ferrugineus TaxID=354439 RepID=A0A834I0D2_RHYFE|nr:hypothetical protein GWI33_017112 [Rhynchophorus ferrugineus]